MPSGGAEGARFTRVDQVRGVAAIAVVVCHLSVSAYVDAPNAGPFWPSRWVPLLLGLGYLGVPLFFVVSGFCIHWPQARAARAAAAAATTAEAPAWKPFFQRRFWRLYPPYALSLAATILLFAATTGDWPVALGDLLPQLGLVHTFDERTFLGINPPAWTLAVEAQLYLAYPLVFLLTRRLGAWRALLAVLAITMTYRLALGFVTLSPRFAGGAWHFFLARWFEWTAGALVAEWAAGNVELPRRIARWWVALPVLVLLVYVGEWHSWHYGIYFIREPLYGAGFALLLLAVLHRAPVPAGRLGTWLAGVGVFSYSLYLVHRPIQLALVPLARRIAASPFVVQYGLPTSVLLFVASTPLVFWTGRLFYRWCEEPFLAAARRIAAPAAARSASLPRVA